MNRKSLYAMFMAAIAAVSAAGAGMSLATDAAADNQGAAYTADMQGYLIKLDGGYIVVYREGENTPLIETGIPAENLRAADRKLLEAGIKVEDYEDIIRLIEDYGS